MCPACVDGDLSVKGKVIAFVRVFVYSYVRDWGRGRGVVRLWRDRVFIDMYPRQEFSILRKKLQRISRKSLS